MSSSPMDRSTVSSPGSRHGPLSSDIQARIMAFQQKRANKPPPPQSPSASSPRDFSLNSISAPNIHSNLNLNDEDYLNNNDSSYTPNLSKALPALPNTRSLSQNDAPPASLIPSPIPNNSNYQLFSQDTAPASNANSLLNQQMARLQLSPEKPFELSKKPSLSQRRGMKLNMNEMKFDNGGNLTDNNNESSISLSSPSMSLSNSISDSKNDLSIPRKPSGKRKPNFSLNLNDLANSNSLDSPLSSNISSLSSSSNSSQTNLDDRNPQQLTPSSSIPNQLQASKKPQLQGLFANYSKYVDVKSGSLNFAGKASLHSKGVDFSSGSSFRISLDELEFIDEIGHGNYGTVSKVIHKPTGVLMAMKEVRLELDETKFTQILMELEILHKCDSPYIVDFYGAFFVEGAVYMCMEYMDGGSLDKVFNAEHSVESEACLAYITECVIRGLKELKDEHNIIHRDVKPTNILVNTLGKVKLCDFGVSGNLVASLAKTNIGCQSYMAPERIRSINPDDATYSIQSDIWSLGLTILEIAAGTYPYPADTYDNIFSQLSAIVDGEPPKLDAKKFSKEAQLFVKSCLNKNPDLRPPYGALLNNPWLVKYRDVDPHMAEIVLARVAQIEEERTRKGLSRSNSTNKAPANPTVGTRSHPSVAGKGFPQVTPVIGNQSSRETVQSLLKNKVNAPALHKGGLSNPNRRFR